MTPLPSTSDDPLFDDSDTWWLIGRWCLVWLLVHHMAWPLWKRRNLISLIFTPSDAERYRRRVCRSQVYCTFCVVGGIRLLSSCRWNCHDLLYAFSAEHQVLFSMAAAHWIVSIWEDRQNATFLRGGLSAADMGGTDPTDFVLTAYVLHHTVACLVFIGSLRMRAFTGLATFGLVFELPVLWMNHREFMVYADSPPAYFRDEGRVIEFWKTLDRMFSIARFGPSAVYLYSLIFWSDDLSKLSYKEAFMYHGFAVFFTLLNYQLYHILLMKWAQKDLDIANSSGDDFDKMFKALTEPSVVELAEAEKEQTSVAEGIPEVVKRPLQKVEEDKWNQITNEGFEHGEIWVEIDDVAYNLTEFMGKHPGGDAILRRYHGKDASQAFHKARHSMEAKILMQNYSVGVRAKELKEYRIFEHIDMLLTGNVARQALALLVIALMLPLSFFMDITPVREEDVTLTSGLLVPGLAFAQLSTLPFFPASQWMRPANWNLPALCIAILGPLNFVGLELARRPMAEGSPSMLPSGLELGAGVIYILEECFHHLATDGLKHQQLGRLFLALSALLLGLSLRGLGSTEMMERNFGHILGGLLFGVTLPLLCRLVSSTSGRTRRDIVTDVSTGSGLAFIFSGLMLCYLLLPSYNLSSFGQMVKHELSFWTLGNSTASFLAVFSACIYLMKTLQSANQDSAAWASRSTALLMSTAVFISGGFSGWRWLSVLAFLALVGALGRRNDAFMDEMQAKGSFEKVGQHRVATRHAWDNSCLHIAVLLWTVIQIFTLLINMFMPEELQFYAEHMPFFNLGDDVDLGVAVYHAPMSGLDSKDAPEHFEFMVRHADTSFAGERDMRRQINENRKKLSELCSENCSASGFIANVNCFFPRLTGSTLSKEVNLSCWVSSQHASSWRTKQATRAESQMRTIGATEATLKPHGPIRHQDRCSYCTRLVEASSLGERAPSRCRYCGHKTFGYSFF
eukprot:TRINITY_DN22618_c0_g1_i1.p1 TRINITY_DN22618_c0_g1~~TRINITY_DN22618_c0_g1_i1.p1  ORF type:complete len:965 (-),score=146.35 TRINITY_DN22618_c0_g1_i1:63-2957(-)